jgi:hypothetical protein
MYQLSIEVYYELILTFIICRHGAGNYIWTWRQQTASTTATADNNNNNGGVEV